MSCRARTAASAMSLAYPSILFLDELPEFQGIR
jgi:predicted ATPase with chaperone activity